MRLNQRHRDLFMDPDGSEYIIESESLGNYSENYKRPKCSSVYPDVKGYELYLTNSAFQSFHTKDTLRRLDREIQTDIRETEIQTFPFNADVFVNPDSLPIDLFLVSDLDFENKAELTHKQIEKLLSSKNSKYKKENIMLEPFKILSNGNYFYKFDDIKQKYNKTKSSKNSGFEFERRLVEINNCLEGYELEKTATKIQNFNSEIVGKKNNFEFNIYRERLRSLRLILFKRQKVLSILKENHKKKQGKSYLIEGMTQKWISSSSNYSGNIPYLSNHSNRLARPEIFSILDENFCKAFNPKSKWASTLRHKKRGGKNSRGFGKNCELNLAYPKVKSAKSLSVLGLTFPANSLKGKHSDITHVSQSQGPEPRVSDKDVLDSYKMIQSLLKGRVMQLKMLTGTQRFLSLIDELQISENNSEKLDFLKIKITHGQHNIEQFQLSMVEFVAGNILSKNLEDLSNSIKRTRELEKAKAFVKYANWERAIRESQELGRRQAEENMRDRCEALFSYISFLTSQSADSFVYYILKNSVNKISNYMVMSQVKKRMLSLDTMSLEEHEKATSYNIVESFLNHFLFPHVQSKLERERTIWEEKVFDLVVDKSLGTCLKFVINDLQNRSWDFKDV